MQTGGEVVIALPATTLASSQYGGFQSVLHFDVHGARVAVEVPQTVATTTNAETDIQLVSVEDDTVSITEEAGELQAAKYVGGMTTVLGMTPYDAATQQWWALREDAGTLYFETSPDGVTYTAFQSMPTPSFASLVAFIVEAGSYQTEMNAGAAHFDNVNHGTRSGQFCPAGTLRDDFNSGTVGDEWGASYISGNCSYGESSGHVTFSLTAAAAEECVLRSATAFDLSNDAVFTEVVSATGLAQTYTILRAAIPSGDAVEVAINGTSLQCGELIGGTYMTTCSLPYDAVAHRFLRLRGSDGMLAWETSPDGTTWTTRGTAVPPIPLDAVWLSVGAGTTGVPAAATTAVFGTFDVLPP